MASAPLVAEAIAQDEHARRLAAELAIMAGDARQLADRTDNPMEREGLVLRLRGGLSSMPLLLRRAGADTQPVAALREMHARKDWRALAARFEALSRHHPFNAPRLLAAPATAQTLALGAALHREHCAACHETSWRDTRLPAKNLSEQFAAMPREEFAARLWLGVRGTRETAHANPFSEAELAALIAYYGQPR